MLERIKSQIMSRHYTKQKEREGWTQGRIQDLSIGGAKKTLSEKILKYIEPITDWKHRQEYHNLCNVKHCTYFFPNQFIFFCARAGGSNKWFENLFLVSFSSCLMQVLASLYKINIYIANDLTKNIQLEVCED
jgi:hypothetical protein